MSAPSPRVLPVGCGYRLTLIKPNPGLRYFPLATLRCAPSDAAARLQGPHVVRPPGSRDLMWCGRAALSWCPWVPWYARDPGAPVVSRPSTQNPPPEPMVVATCWEEPSV